MASITIKNVGPIQYVNLALNKVNIFMGPQSSGKSTIAKLISYCTWVEKDVATSQSLDEYNVNGNFRKKLEDFHRLTGYFNEGTEIYYESDVIKLQFKNNKCSVEWVDKYAYKRNKIAYIPSERNLIILPFIYTIALPNNNIRDFLFNWLTLRKKYHKENQIKILDLPVAYYYKESMGLGEDHIISIDENEPYDILLENASSGLQSLSPLFVTLKYMTEWIYENEEDISFEKRQTQYKVSRQLMKELILEKYYPNEKFETEEQISEQIKEMINLSPTSNEVAARILQWYGIQNNLEKTSTTQFIIEEPEQNLFPETQRDLVYHLLQLITGERDHRLTITTHSPYILYALNNCMFGKLVFEKMDEEDKAKIVCKSSLINPKEVSIYQIDGGILKKIQQEDGLIGSNYFDEKMKEIMDDFYTLLKYYDDAE